MDAPVCSSLSVCEGKDTPMQACHADLQAAASQGSRNPQPDFASDHRYLRSFMGRSSQTTIGIAAVSSLLAAGCAVGPNFRKPPAPPADAYAVSPVATASTAAVAGGEAQRFLLGADLTADWWTLFH